MKRKNIKYTALSAAVSIAMAMSSLACMPGQIWADPAEGTEETETETQTGDESETETEAETEKQNIGAAADQAVDEEAAMEEAMVGAENPVSARIDTEDAISITIADGELTARKGDKKIKEEKLNQHGITFDGYNLKLTKGVFILTGQLEGQINVEAGKRSETAIILDDFTLVNTTDEAVTCESTGSLVIISAEGSENTIISGEEVEINEETITLTEEAIGGAIYSRADTYISGSGILNIYGYINNGIHSTKSLTIDDGTVNVTAANNGIKTKVSFVQDGGTINITSGNDGIQSKDEGVEAVEEVVDEETGEVITEAVEGIADEGTITINGGRLTIDCYNDGLEALTDLTINGGFLTIGASGTYYTKGSYSKTRNKTFSGKGIKSGDTLNVNGGTTVIKSYNDGVNSVGLLTVSSGVLSIYCGDDGIHSDSEIDINGGLINISNSTEGIEANQIIINDGTISLFAWDDGMNASGGSGFGSGGRKSQSGTQRQTPNIIINGGDIYIDADGDGVDSNGNITVNGGKLVVDGPTQSMNGPLDGGTENGGQITITGGLVFAGGSSGMAEGFSSKSEQVSCLVTMSNGYKEGSTLSFSTADGTELFSHSPASGGNSIVFSCPELKEGETYILTIDDNEYEITMSSISTKAQLKKVTAETTASAEK